VKNSRFLIPALMAIIIPAVPLLAQMDWTLANPAAPWAARDEHAVVVLRDTVWLTGGENQPNEQVFDDVWWSADGVLWNQATDSAGWESRFNHTSLAYNNQLWVLGGRTIGANKNDVWSSPDGIHWTLVVDSANWSHRIGHTSLVFNNEMWVIGGANSNDVWHSSDGATWTQATPGAQWSGRQGHVSVVYDGKMWVMGGYGWSGWQNDVWYSTNGSAWIQATDSAGWKPRTNAAAVVFDNKMWVLGGDAGPSVTGGEVWYSTNGVDWTRADTAAPWQWRQSLAVADFQNKLWVLGGREHSLIEDDLWYTTGLSIAEHTNPSVAGRVSLSPATPNPFRDRVGLEYSIARTGTARLSIFNSTGREIRVLSGETQTAGHHQVNWNGCDDAGRAVPDGIYYVTLSTPGETARAKILKLP
jgi:hypothetical protein